MTRTHLGLRRLFGAAVLVAAVTLTLPAQSTPAAVVVRHDSIAVTFPPIALSETGCGQIDSAGPVAGKRRLLWMASETFADSHYPANHFLSVYVNFYLPVGVPLTEARLDSALTAQRIHVEEPVGEPAITGRTYPTTLTRAEFVGSQVHFTIEGKAAVAAFLSPKQDSVTLLWCQRGQVISALDVPLQRR